MSQDKNFKVNRYFPVVTVILGIMGAIGLMGSTANLDTGEDREIWHTTCASIFFVFTALAIYYNSFIATVLYSHKVVSKVSYYKKVVLMILITIQVYLDFSNGNSYGLFVSGPQGDNTGHILEYTASFSILFYIYLIGDDVKKYWIAYE